MQAVLLTLVIGIVIATASIVPITLSWKETETREVLATWSQALQAYRGDHCHTTAVTAVSEQDLIDGGFLPTTVHDKIMFSARITAAGRVINELKPRTGFDKSVLTTAWVITEGNIDLSSGARLDYSSKSYSQGNAPPGYITLMTFDDRNIGCKQ